MPQLTTYTPYSHAASAAHVTNSFKSNTSGNVIL